MSTTYAPARPAPMEQTPDQNNAAWTGIYRIGGVCLVLAGIIYGANTILGWAMAAAPADTPQYLRSLADHPGLARAIYGFYSLADVLFVPALLALYLALRSVARTWMLIATGLMALFVVVDMALTEAAPLVIVSLTHHAAAATTAPDRAAYTAAADYALAVVPLATFYSWVLSSAWVLLSAIAMLRGPFAKRLARLGIVVGVAGIVGGFYVLLPAVSVILTPTLLAFGLWLVLTGVALFRLSPRRTVASTATAPTGLASPAPRPKR